MQEQQLQAYDRHWRHTLLALRHHTSIYWRLVLRTASNAASNAKDTYPGISVTRLELLLES